MELTLQEVLDNRPIRFAKWFFNFVGLWPRNESILWYNLRTFLLHFFMTFIYVSTMLINIYLERNISDLVQTVTEFSSFGKFLSFLWGRHQMQVFYSELMEDKTFSLKTKEEVKLAKDKLKMYELLANFYFILCFVAVSTAMVTSYFSDPPRPAYPAWFPFDISKSNVAFFGVFIYQYIGVTIHGFTFVGWDNFFVFLMVNIQIQLRVLAQRLREEFKEKDASELETKKKLIAIFKHHKAILHLSDQVQSYMSFPMALQVNVSGLVVCISIIQVIKLSIVDELPEVMQFFSFMLALTIQVYLLCYFGNEITVASQEVFRAVHESNWPDLSISNRKMLLIFGEKLKRPIQIQAMKLFTISLSTFTSVMNSAYSLFAVLKNFN